MPIAPWGLQRWSRSQPWCSQNVIDFWRHSLPSKFRLAVSLGSRDASTKKRCSNSFALMCLPNAMMSSHIYATEKPITRPRLWRNEHALFDERAELSRHWQKPFTIILIFSLKPTQHLLDHAISRRNVPQFHFIQSFRSPSQQHRKPAQWPYISPGSRPGYPRRKHHGPPRAQARSGHWDGASPAVLRDTI